MSLLPEVQEHFSKHLEEYALSGSPEINIANVKGNTRVLEIGCGAKFSLSTTGELFGVDLTKSLLVDLKKRNNQANLILADSRCLPFINQQFDDVGVVFVLHHLVGGDLAITKKNIEKSISEMARITNGSGKIIVVEHLINNQLSSILCYFITLFLAKFSINLDYLDIHDKVVTYFLDKKYLMKNLEAVGFKAKILNMSIWNFRRIKLGYDMQLEFSRKP